MAVDNMQWYQENPQTLYIGDSVARPQEESFCGQAQLTLFVRGGGRDRPRTSVHPDGPVVAYLHFHGQREPPNCRILSNLIRRASYFESEC